VTGPIQSADRSKLLAYLPLAVLFVSQMAPIAYRAWGTNPQILRELVATRAVILGLCLILGWRFLQQRYDSVLERSEEIRAAERRAGRMGWIGLGLFVAGFVVMISPSFVGQNNFHTRTIAAIPGGILLFAGMGFIMYERFTKSGISQLAFTTTSEPISTNDWKAARNKTFRLQGASVLAAILLIGALVYLDPQRNGFLGYHPSKAELDDSVYVLIWVFVLAALVWTYLKKRQATDLLGAPPPVRRASFLHFRRSRLMWVADCLYVLAFLWFMLSPTWDALSAQKNAWLRLSVTAAMAAIGIAVDRYSTYIEKRRAA
jgi:hypothetical protein